MTNTTQATKCIAVSTPFGLMYLELMEGTKQYIMADDDAVTDATYDKLAIGMSTIALEFKPHDEHWVKVFTFDEITPSFLPITSNYGNTFP